MLYACYIFCCSPVTNIAVFLVTGYTDPAWEEYLSTGIDPTGGELGPDFDPETDEPLEEDETDEE